MNKLIIMAMSAALVFEAKAADLDTIVFVREGKDALGQPNMILERIQADGGGRSVIFDASIQENTDKPEGQQNALPQLQRSPDISPLGKKLVLRRGFTVSAMNWDGTGAVNVTPYLREWYDARWSPDGKKIALSTDIGNTSEIYVMDFDGGNLHNLSWKAKTNQRSPDWSPDGKKISFISDRNGKFELFTMNADDGTDQTRILSLEGDIREPAWGPNNRIAFALQKPDGNSALYVVDPDGTNVTQLTDGSFWDGQVAWNADGKQLAFASNRSGISNIWVMDVASKKLRNVTNNPDQSEIFPVWVPKQISDQAPKIAAVDGLATNIAGRQLPRPRLLFRSDDLRGIRDKLAKEPFAPVWKAFLAQCDALLDPESAAAKKVGSAITAIKDNPSKGLYDRSDWIIPVFDLAFAWQVTGERRYGERAATWLTQIAGEYAKWHQTMVFEYPVACAYDWLHDILPPDDLRLITGLLQTSARRSYHHVMDFYFGETNYIDYNFATHDAGSIGPLALALLGEPGSEAAWLRAAARLATINLNRWIDAAGGAAEGVSYFNRPIELLLPFLVSLKINDLYPETSQSNLRKFADWLAIINAGGTLPSIGDSDGGDIIFPVGLLQLYPENLTARKLWNSIQRPEKPAPDVLSLLWFTPSENKPQEYPDLPRTAYFENQNYQVLRSGYGDDSSLLTFALTAGGHAHLEGGAISLAAFGEKLLVDAGQAVSAADTHSQLLIDGAGRFKNYVPANAQSQRISPIQSGELASASSVNLLPAFVSRDVGSQMGSTYSIPAPGMILDRGSRTVAMVGDDTTAVPPYYLMYDDVRRDDKATLYEQLYIGDADEVARDNGDGSFVFENRYAGPWLTPISGAKGEATLDFKIEKPGNYQVWVYLKELSDTFTFQLGEFKPSVKIGPRVTRQNCGQWVAAGDALAVSAGKQTMTVLPGGVMFAKVALIPEAQAKDFSGWGELPEGSVESSCADATLSGEAWMRESNPSAELLVTSLNTDPVAFEEDTFSFHTRFYGQLLVTLPRAKLVKRQPEANFLTLLYPYLPGMEQPSIRKENDGAVLTWKNAVDTVTATPTELVVRRKHPDGKEEDFKYQMGDE